jgi:Ni/Fe-hydrogenase 1 B-type cytochrome subunit
VEKAVSSLRRVLIWSGWLRASHWLIATSVILLAFTGWLTDSTPSVAAAASDYHYLFATVLIIGLVLRLWLLFFDNAIGHWRKLIPSIGERGAFKQMFLFYFSLGKMSLPNWYAHNPLWKLAYLILFLVLFLQVMTGMYRDEYPIVLGVYLPEVHGVLASVILLFTGLHIIAVVLHDLKGTASDISALINGHKIFVINKPKNSQGVSEHPISLKQLRK